MDENRPPMPSPSLMVISVWILRITFGLYVACSHSVRDNLHALFTFVRRAAAVACVVVLIIEDDYFTECVLNLIALLAGLVSPLLEFG